MKLLSKVLRAAIDLRNSLNKSTSNHYVKEKKMGDAIPKSIHQIYFIHQGNNELPKEVEANIDAIKKLNPDWKYKLYNDKDIEVYINEHFPELIVFYKKINPKYGAARADFFRYLLIYNEGGVYLDVKANMSKPLDEIIHKNDKYILSHWPRSYPKVMLGQHPGITNPTGELQQWHIISVAGHPFLRSVIDNMCYNIEHYNPILHDYGSWGVFNLTGPIAYTEAIYPLLANHSHRLEKDHLEIGLIYYALGAEDDMSGHHKIFPVKHYSKLEESITAIPLHKQALFSLSKPFIKFLKSKYNN